jgi:hypothetical protein
MKLSDGGIVANAYYLHVTVIMLLVLLIHETDWRTLLYLVF